MISTRTGIHLHSQFLYKQIEIQLCFYAGNYDGKVAKVDVEGFPEFLTSASLSLRGTVRRGSFQRFLDILGSTSCRFRHRSPVIDHFKEEPFKTIFQESGFIILKNYYFIRA